MKYKLTRYIATGEIEGWKQAGEPDLEQLQSLVGGLIERVPQDYYLGHRNKWFAGQHKGELDAVWCHEEALLLAEPVLNPHFPMAPWGARLYGDILVVEKI